MTNKIVTWNNNFFTEENKSALRQSKQLRMRTKSAQSIITKSCHSLQFIAISQRSVNKLSAQLISYLHLILYVVIMTKFTSLQNSAPDKNSPFWVVSEHLTLSITKIPTGAFAKCFANIRRHPLKPGALSSCLPCLLVVRPWQYHFAKWFLLFQRTYSSKITNTHNDTGQTNK